MSQLPRSMIEAQPKLNTDQLKLDRRRCPRRAAEELVTAVFSQGDDRLGVTRLLLLDVSHTGIGAACEKPLDPGTRVTLTSHGIPMPHKSGTVVRCLVTTEGYLLGIQLDKRRA
jgi:hypothetical protein